MADVNYRLLPSSRTIKINTLEELNVIDNGSEPGVINLDDEIFNMEYNISPAIESLNSNYNVFKVEDLGNLNNY